MMRRPEIDIDGATATIGWSDVVPATDPPAGSHDAERRHSRAVLNVVSPQHSGTLTASPPSDVSLYLLSGSRWIRRSRRCGRPGWTCKHHWIAEQLLDRTPMLTKHLRPTFFAEWLDWSWATDGTSGVIRLPMGGGRHAPVAGEDQAYVIAVLLENPEPHDRKIYPGRARRDEPGRHRRGHRPHPRHPRACGVRRRSR